MAKFGRVSYPKTDFKGLKIRYLSEKKFGKTGWLEAIDEKFRKGVDDFTVLVLEIGSENGTDAIYCNAQHIDTFAKFIEVIDDIVAHPEDYPPMIAIDTENELSRLAENYAIDQYNKERDSGKKKAKSINGAFGGHHSGQFYARNIIKEQFGRLYIAGKGRITTGHTKRKEVTDKTAENGEVMYEQITSNLMSTYDNAYAESADIIMIGHYRYNEVEDKNGDTIKKERVISFTSRESTSIGSGSRFLGIAESVTLKTYNDGATAEDMYAINLKNGYKIIDIIETALRGNAKARGLEVTGTLDHLDSIKSPPPTKKVNKNTKKGTKEKEIKDEVVKIEIIDEPKLLDGDKLWESIVEKIKESPDDSKEIKKMITKICGVTQGKLSKPYIINGDTTTDQIKELNELISKY